MTAPSFGPCVVLASSAALFLVGCVAVAPPGGNASRQAAAAAAADAGNGTSAQGTTCTEACPSLDCPEGTHAAPLSGDCCPSVCEPDDCSVVDCPPLDCAAGTHSTQPKGTCCRVCSPNPTPSASDTCEEGQAGYDSYVAQITASLGAGTCTQDGDCRLVVIDNPCSHGCGTAVAARFAETLKQDLNDYAATHCAACPTGGAACPSTERTAFCTGGVCSAH